MKRKSSVRILALALLAITLTAPPAQAYYSTIDTGDLVAPGQYQVSLEGQALVSEYNGGNIVGRFDTGLTNESAVRGVLGFGEVDFQLGGFYKYIPFPDTPNQPALGGEAGLLIARLAGQTEVSVRVHPLISKKFESEIGDLSPYASIPFGLTFRNGATYVPSQFVVGGELRPLNLKNWSFFAELGIELAHSFSYISVAAAWRFDDGTMTRHH